MWELRKREQTRLTPGFWLGQRLSGGALTVKRNIKAVSTEYQAQRKYFVKISYNDYPKFNFRHVMLDKYLVGNRGQVRGS